MTVLVNVDNFVRAETDRMFDFILRDSGTVNAWVHNRVPTPFDHQPVIRQNRDTLYSAVVVDVTGGARLTLPDAGGRYLSAMVVNEDHYIPHIFHSAGVHAIDEANSGTAYVMIAIRILVDPDDPKDVAIVNALQDAIMLDAASATPFTHPQYDDDTFSATREHLIALSKGLPDYRGAFGKQGEVDEVHHLLGSASAWGGFPEYEATYLNVEPQLPPGDYSLTVRDVPVDAFWSITVYNAQGYMDDKGTGTASINSVTATPDPDGSVTVHFGDGNLPNTIPTPDGWNYLVRLYRPHAEIIDRTWTFPTLTTV